MKPFGAIVCDFDRTLTDEKFHPVPEALDCLEKARNQLQAKLILVTGRRLSSLKHFLKKLDLFDAIVAENGGVIVFPRTGRKISLASRAKKLKAAFRHPGFRVRFGEVVIATGTRHYDSVKKLIRKKRLRANLVRNLEDLMILPPGVDKLRGLRRSLAALEAGEVRIIVFGDAENDLALFEVACIRVAVSNAVDELKRKATHVTKGYGGWGTAEFLSQHLAMKSERQVYHA